MSGSTIVWICIAIMFWLIVIAQHSEGKAPISYAGRPPTVQTPGRCWCRWHGPRGGCLKWVCHRRPEIH